MELSASQLDELAERLDTSIEEYSVTTLTDKPRTHLGISEIGEGCYRKLYYKFRWVDFEVYDGRMLRLFKRGHREEERYISYLEGIGCKVDRFDENGKQFRVSGVMGHYGGSCDGQAITPWYPIKFLLEFKTHNTKSFTHYEDKGLLKSKPKHYDQMCGYGFKMNIHYGIYFPENKNDDDIKITVVKLDHNRGLQLEAKAQEIILAKEPPPRISESPAFFDCQFCFAKDVCFNGKIPQKNCRSCRMSSPVDNAEWNCNRFNSVIPSDFIANGCQHWMPI